MPADLFDLGILGWIEQGFVLGILDRFEL